MLHNLHILIVAISLSAVQLTAQEVTGVRPHWETREEGWSLGTVGVSRKGRRGEESATYIITDRKLEELRSQYKDFLNPDELQGKKILDLGTGGGSMVTSIRHYGKTLCAQGQGMIAQAKDYYREGQQEVKQGEGLDSTGKALLFAGEQILRRTLPDTFGDKVGLAVCGMGDEFCRKAEELRDSGKGLCEFAREMALDGKKQIERGKGIKGSFADIHGIDIALPPHLKALRDENGKPFFVQGDAARTPYKDKEFDRLFSSWSIFIYEGANRDLMTKMFRESNRILKAGGKLTISPILDQHWAALKPIVAASGFKVTRAKKNGADGQGFDPSQPELKGTFYNVELEKVGDVKAPVVAQRKK